MTEKEFGVFGLGDFGKSVALTLAQNGCQVLAVDCKSEIISEIADYVTQAIKMDVRDIEALRSLSLGNFFSYYNKNKNCYGDNSKSS